MSILSGLILAIPAYTGLSPVSFATLTSILLTIYYIVSGFFAVTRHSTQLKNSQLEPWPAPVKIGDVTEEELRSFDGSDPTRPLLMAIKGQIYDVSQSRCALALCFLLTFDSYILLLLSA
jgi:membrane-associated progesterone receptor component